MDSYSVVQFVDSYRRLPCKDGQRKPKDEHVVCNHCLGGTCCSSEGPIALTAFDILRLATYFELSPSDFLLTFTQDRFGEVQDFGRFSAWSHDEESSIVTFLRRRSNHVTSPCIFLKYVVSSEGIPRRVCSVHPARPIACREYYYDTCKKRWTGELAVVQAQGLEAAGQGKITQATAEAAVRALGSGSRGSLSAAWQFAFWSEMRRACDIESANQEGALSYPLKDLQDPLDEKLNRLLSKRHLRFEEKYGLVPHGDQLDAYSAGRSFSASPERERLMHIATTKPGTDLYTGQDYPYFVGLRTLSQGLALSPRYQTLPRPKSNLPIDGALWRGWSFLVSLGDHALATGELLELEAPGTIEQMLASELSRVSPRIQREVTGRVWLRTSIRLLAEQAITSLESELQVRLDQRTSATEWIAYLSRAGALLHRIEPGRLHGRIERILERAVSSLTSKKEMPALERLCRRSARESPTESIIGWLILGQRTRRQGGRVLQEIQTTRLHREWERSPGSVIAIQNALMFSNAAPLPRYVGDVWKRTLANGRFAWSDAQLPEITCLAGRVGAVLPNDFAQQAGDILQQTQQWDGAWGIDLSATTLPDWQDAYILQAIIDSARSIEALCTLRQHWASQSPSE